MVAMQAVIGWQPSLGLTKNLLSLVTSVLLAGVALALLALTAWLSARTTLYTLTDKRIIQSAALAHRNGTNQTGQAGPRRYRAGP